MRLLLRAALVTKKHILLLVASFATLFLLTIASQLEVFSLGLITNTGSDFFDLFASKKELRVAGAKEEISLEDVIQKWPQIDKEGKGTITPKEASLFLAQKEKKDNPLKWFVSQARARFDMENNLTALVWVLVAVALFKAVCLFFSRYSTQLLSIRVSRDLREKYFEHIQLLPMSFYNQYHSGSLSARVVSDSGQIASSLNSFVTNYLQTPFILVSCLSVSFYLSWQLSLVVFVAMPLIILPIVILARRIKRIVKQLQLNQEAFSSVLLDFLAGVHTVKIFAMELFSFKKYKEQNDRMAHLEAKSAKYSFLTRPILHTITTFCLAFIVLIGMHTLKMSVSEILVFAGLLHQIYEPIKKFADENANIQRGIAAAERMYEVMALKPHIEDCADALMMESFNDKIEFDNVSFKYKEHWVLKNLSFTIQKGQTVAIVGATGAGKSTIVQLLPRLYEVQSGEIRIDGIPLQKFTQKSLRENIGYVSQKPFFFVGTIKENISYGKEFSLEDVVAAAKKAHAHEFIEKLDQKYETHLSEAAKNLSGGQQQRLAIARALVKKAPILILDEATSSLDALSEAHIKKAIEDLHGEVTQIIIAHRLSTIEHADKIIYMRHGEKIAEGTKDELLVSCEEFRLTWNTMFSMEKNSSPELAKV